MRSNVELLGTGGAVGARGDGDAPSSPSRIAALCVAAGLAFLGMVYAVPGAHRDVEAGQLFQPVGPQIGDPFAREWLPLDGAATGPSGYERPLPMVRSDPPCFGFGRLDWPEADRQPTVARCFDQQTADQLPANGVVALSRITAGADTWVIFLFSREVSQIEVRLGTQADQVIESDRVYLGHDFAAVLVPTGRRPTSLSWQERGGQRYELSDSL